MSILIGTEQLSQRQAKELDKLLEVCFKYDKGSPALYAYLLKQKRETKNTLLLYRNKKLIGFLSVYFFYENACELSIMIAPAHRRQGLCMRLLKTIMPLLLARNMEKLIFSMAPDFGGPWLSSLGFTQQQSEYHMERPTDERQTIASPKLSISKASLDDLEILYHLDAICFPVQAIDMKTRLAYLLNNPECTILLASYEGRIIGKAHMHRREAAITLSDIAIEPESQGRGFGTELLAVCINRILDSGKNKIVLDVEANNQGALNLYKRQGFVTTESYDFWFIGMQELIRHLRKPG